ncbi:MAG: 4Fe-4S binding protein [Peptococcaceae bacterium]|nr:4Fe-4S binding protein [Peptococcaceae bacterium]
MKKIAYVNPNLCDRSPGCPAIKVCPSQALSHKRAGMFSYDATMADPEKCTGCAKCLNNCPGGAIKMIPANKVQVR